MIKRTRRKNSTCPQITGIIDLLPDPTFAVDLDGKVIIWNKAMAKLAGVKADKMIGKSHYAYAIPFYGRRRPFLVDLIRRSGKKTSKEYSNVHWEAGTVTADTYAYNAYSGKGAYMWCKASPLYGAGGKLAGAIEVIRDVTDRVKELKEKEDQKALLGAINEMAVRLANASPERNIYKLICDELRAALGALAVSVAVYDKQENTITVKYVSTSNWMMNKMTEFLGRRPIGARLPLKGWKKKVIDGEIVNYVDDLSDITFGAVSKSTGRLANEALGIDHFTALILKYNGNEPVGTLTVAMSKGRPKIAKDIYNICANLIDVVMRRHIAEESLSAAAERYAKYVEHAPYGIVLVDRDGHFVDANGPVCRITGYAREELIGMHTTDIAVHSEYEREKVLDVLTRKGHNAGLELIRRKDGALRWLHIKRVRLSQDLFIGFSDDVTAHKASLDALKDSEEKYRELFNKSNDCISLIKVDLEDYPGRFIDVNETACRELGYTKEEFLKFRVADILDVAELMKVQELKTVFINDNAVLAEIALTAKSGKKIPYELSVHGFTMHGEKLMLVIGRNVAERHNAEKQQQEYVQNLSHLYSSAMEFVEMKSESDIYVSISDQLRKFIGQEAFAFVSSWEEDKGIMRVRSISGQDGMLKAVKVARQRLLVNVEFPLNAGSKGLLLQNKLAVTNIEGLDTRTLREHERQYLRLARKLGMKYIYYAGLTWQGRLLGAISIVTINEVDDAQCELIATFLNQSAIAIQRNNTETALRKSEENYRAIFNSVTDVVLIIDDRTADIVDVNDKADEVLGYKPDMIRKLGMKVLLPDDKEYGWDAVAALFKSLDLSRTKTFEWLAVTQDGRTIWVEVSARRILLLGKPCVMLLVRDITERKYAEEERKGIQSHLIETEKMASLGTLAGGISHEFNNMLQLISGNAEYALKVGDREKVNKSLNAVLMSSERAAKIVGNLLKFSKPDDYDDSRKDVRQLLELVFSLVEIQLKKQNITIVRDFGNVPALKVNGNAMQQVFLNLINNARDAMLPAGGVLTVSVHEKPGRVEILFADSGQGIEPEHIKKVFDPFFTTKGSFGGSAVPGTGLGLFVCYGIIQRQNGTISVESRPGRGTTFKIELPVNK
jgi:PAS domain S-box-containing protein